MRHKNFRSVRSRRKALKGSQRKSAFFCALKAKTAAWLVTTGPERDVPPNPGRMYANSIPDTP